MRFGNYQILDQLIRGISLLVGLSIAFLVDVISVNRIGIAETAEWVGHFGYLYVVPVTFIGILIPKFTQLCELKSLRANEIARLKAVVSIKVSGLWIVVLYCLLMSGISITSPMAIEKAPGLGMVLTNAGILAAGSVIYIFVGLILLEFEIRDFVWASNLEQRENEEREGYLERMKNQNAKNGDELSDLNPRKKKTHKNGKTKKAP